MRAEQKPKRDGTEMHTQRRERRLMVVLGLAAAIVWGGLWLTLRPVCEIDNRAKDVSDRDANDYVAAVRDELRQRVHNPSGLTLLTATVTTDPSRHRAVDVDLEYRSGNQTGGVTRFRAFATLDRSGRVVSLWHLPAQAGVDFSGGTR